MGDFCDLVVEARSRMRLFLKMLGIETLIRLRCSVLWAHQQPCQEQLTTGNHRERHLEPHHQRCDHEERAKEPATIWTS